MIQALIFDFDGLILETEVPAFQSWQAIYREYGCDLPLEEWVACIGGTTQHFDAAAYLETTVGYPLPQADIQVRRKQLHLKMVEQLEVLPGVENYVQEARKLGLKVGLASNSSRQWVAGHLKRLGLYEQFDCICCGDEVEHQKPEPDLYLAALQGLHLTAEQAVAFEDSPNGVRAAQRAGIFAIAVPNAITQQLPLGHADLRIPSMAARPLADLLAQVEKMRSNATLA
ncbi:MAG TPA: HAD family hydrolase [Ktedonobacteraceae bacterium]|jgi:HAD superfamily hydrolase (TIGR01509 family)|nr:HAD family hydrolase [Ktedonobacteraceae bacterium]